MKVWVFEGDKEEILIILKANMEMMDGPWFMDDRVTGC
jgi:hypothetical protein